jgi:hypothetical protein
MSPIQTTPAQTITSCGKEGNIPRRTEFIPFLGCERINSVLRARLDGGDFERRPVGSIKLDGMASREPECPYLVEFKAAAHRFAVGQEQGFPIGLGGGKTQFWKQVDDEASNAADVHGPSLGSIVVNDFSLSVGRDAGLESKFKVGMKDEG